MKRLVSEQSFSLESSNNSYKSNRSGGAVTSSLPLGRWTYSKPRQLAFWVKKSLSQVVDGDKDFELNLGHLQDDKNIKIKYNVESKDVGGHYTSSDEHYDVHQPDIVPQLPLCQNIDDAIGSLYSVSSDSELYEHNCISHVYFDYDWLLDGEPEIKPLCEGHEDEQQQQQQQEQQQEEEEQLPLYRKHSISGDEALDFVLAGMELELFSHEGCSDSKNIPQSNVNISSLMTKDQSLYRPIEIKAFDEISQASELSDTEICSLLENHSRCTVDEHCNCIIPNFLPYEDPSTPEGAFFRGIQLERDSLLETANMDDDYEDVTSDFYEPNSYPVLDYLFEAPWNDVIDSDADGSIMEQFLLNSLSSLDMASKHLHNKLLREIKKKENDIGQELINVQSINWDVSASLSYARQVSSYIHHIQGKEKAGMGGSEIIVCNANRRNQLNRIDMLLKDIEEIVKNEAAVFSFCDSFTASIMTKGDCLTILLETCLSLKKRLLHDERFQCLSCLDKSRERVSRIFGYICKKIEEELIMFLYRRCCNSDFDSEEWNDDRFSEYMSLLNARINVNEFQLKECNDNENNGIHVHEFEKEHIAMKWVTRISEAFCFEADRCLARALLEPTKLSSDTNNESLFDDNIRQMKSEIGDIQAFSENAATLRKIVKNLMSIRFEFEKEKDMLPKILHSLCFNLASIMHSYSSFMEWHQSPSNHELLRCDSGFLRCDSPMNEENCETRIEVEKLDVLKDDITKSTASSNCSKSSTLSQQQLPTTIPKGQEYSGMPKWKDMKITSDIYTHMHRSREKILEKCCVVIKTVLDAALDALSETDTNSCFSSWSQDLDSLHCVYRLCAQMDCFVKHFFSGDNSNISLLTECSSDDSQNSSISSSLICMFRSFLRKAHVESMTEVGTMMSSENWELLPIKLNEGSPTPNLVRQSIHSYLQDLEPTQSISVIDGTVSSLWKNHFVLEYQSGFSFMFLHVNPFVPLDEISSNSHGNSLNSLKGDTTPACADENNEVYEELLKYIARSDTRELMIGSKSSTYALGRWTKRLIHIQNNLPLVADEVSQVLCNLYDLYFLTIFRICCGSTQSESIILGSATRSDFSFNERFPLDLQPNKKQAKSVGAVYSSSRRTNILVTNSCADDINAPLLGVGAVVSNLEKFIRRGQQELSTMVKLDQVEKWQFVGTKGNQIDTSDYTFTCLKKRLAAASSCLFAACLLNVSIAHINVLSETDIISGYHSGLMNVIIHMKKTMFRVAATRAIGSQRIVSNIVSIGDGWAETELNSHSNTYIDRFSDRFIQLWIKLSSCSSLKKVPKLVYTAWEYCVEAGFRTLLEGFSKIYDCSTEGRALMSIDLATFSNNISKNNLADQMNPECLPPITVSPKFGMQYVDMYIKVFYFPPEDVIEWIRDHISEYHLTHLLTLVSFGAHNHMTEAEMKHLVQRRQRIKGYYCARNKDGCSRSQIWRPSSESPKM